MKTSIKANLNTMHLSDVYSLMLFLIYKVQDIPEYMTLSELCYILDGNNLTRLFTYFAGRTVTFPTEEEFVIMTNALLMYQAIDLDGKTFVDALAEVKDVTAKQKDKVVELYLKIKPVIKQYNIDRTQVQKNGR